VGTTTFGPPKYESKPIGNLVVGLSFASPRLTVGAPAVMSDPTMSLTFEVLIALFIDPSVL